MSTRKLFSVEEANALLPQLESILARVIHKKETMDRLHDELFISELLQEAAPKRQASADHGKQNEPGAHEVDARISELEEEIAQIRGLGCILRNLDAGWVEFPARLQSETVYLCWKKGEPEIRFYRQTNTAFTERLPL